MGVFINIKRDARGEIAKCKAHRAVCGNFQTFRSDYAALYAPVVWMELVRLMLAIYIPEGFSIDQIDIKEAFLHATLSEPGNIWVQLPKNVRIRSTYCRLVHLAKSLYGLCQARELWYKLLSTTLAKVGFRRSQYSDCLFIGGTKSNPAYIVEYVYDFLLIGNPKAFQDAKVNICKRLTVTDLCPCSQFLGIKIERRSDGPFLSQVAYVNKILE